MSAEARLAWLFGWRYLRARRRARFISFTALSAIVGLGLGIAVLITVLSIMNGFGNALRERILGTVPQVTLMAGNSPQPVLPLLRQLQSLRLTPAGADIRGAAPFFETQAMLLHQGSVLGVGLFGVDPAAERGVSIVPSHMVHGRLSNLTAVADGIVLGEPLALLLGIAPGDRVTLLVPVPDQRGGVRPIVLSLLLVATFQVNAEVDYKFALIDWRAVQALGIAAGGRFGVRLRVADLLQAGATAARLREQLANFGGIAHVASGMPECATSACAAAPGLAPKPGPPKPALEIADWSARYGELFAAVAMEKVMMGLLLGLVVAIAAFNVVSTLVMLVDDKRSDIAVLRTLGASQADVRRIFLTHGALIAGAGLALGVAAGLLLAHSVTAIAHGIEWLLGQSLLGQSYFSEVPSEVVASDLLVVLLLGLAVSLAASIYPAGRAAAADPVQGLHRE